MSRYDFAVGIARDLERRQSPRWAVENKEYHLSSPLILSLLRRLAEEFAPELKDFGFSMPDVYARLATPEPFPNVPPHHWARASVETLRKAGILVGDSSGKF